MLCSPCRAVDPESPLEEHGLVEVGEVQQVERGLRRARLGAFQVVQAHRVPARRLGPQNDRLAVCRVGGAHAAGAAAAWPGRRAARPAAAPRPSPRCPGRPARRAAAASLSVRLPWARGTRRRPPAAPSRSGRPATGGARPRCHGRAQLQARRRCRASDGRGREAGGQFQGAVGAVVGEQDDRSRAEAEVVLQERDDELPSSLWTVETTATAAARGGAAATEFLLACRPGRRRRGSGVPAVLRRSSRSRLRRASSWPGSRASTSRHARSAASRSPPSCNRT